MHGIIRVLVTAIVAVYSGTAVGSLTAFAIAEHAFQRTFGPGACGPADPVYIKGATETGGLPFFMAPTEVSKSAHIMIANMTQEELMLWAAGEGEKTYSIPIDSSVERATFMVSFDSKGGTLTVTAPDGTVVQQGERIEDTLLNCGRVVTVDKPTSGTWQVRLAPTGRFFLAARAKSELSLIGAEFVEPGGRLGHEGLFRIQGRPMAGKPATLRVTLSSELKSPVFSLVSVDARPLQTVNLKNDGDHDFVADIELPSEPFRVLVTAPDGSGTTVQRINAALFHGERVQVIPPAGDTVLAGADGPVTFTVRNVGPPVRLRLVASDHQGKVLAVEPSVLELDRGGDGTATVRLTVPVDAPSESQVSVFLSASSDGPPPASNYANKEFTVTRR